MELPEELLAPTRPMLHLPWDPDDPEEGLPLWLNLGWIGHFVDDFGAAVLLAEHALTLERDLDLWARWRKLAGREGAISLHDYAVSLSSIRKFCKEHAELDAKINHRRLIKIEQAFDKRFSRARRPRIGAAHLADVVSTREKMMGAAKKQDGGYQWSMGELDEQNVYRVTFQYKGEAEAQEVSYDLTRDALAFLVNNLKELIEEFRPFFFIPPAE